MRRPTCSRRPLTWPGVLLATLVVALGCASGGSDDDAAVAAAPSEPAADLQVCDLVTVAEASALLADALREPKGRGAVANTLGRCSWTADDNGRTLSVWAIEPSMWDEVTGRDSVGAVDGLGIRAHRLRDGGVYVDPGGKPYFLQVFVIDTDGSINHDLTLAGAALAID